VIRRLLTEAEDYRQAQANIESLSAANISALLIRIAHGFSGAKTPPPRTAPKDFLPYPDWTPREAPESGPDDATRLLLIELVRANRVPLYVFTALSKDQG
jgi:hypothetical protein